MAWFGRKAEKMAVDVLAEGSPATSSRSKRESAFNGLANALEPEPGDPSESERTRIAAVQTSTPASTGVVPADASPANDPEATVLHTPGSTSDPKTTRAPKGPLARKKAGLVRPPSPPPVARPGEANRMRMRSPGATDAERTIMRTDGDDERTRFHPAGPRVVVPRLEDDEHTRIRQTGSHAPITSARADEEATQLVSGRHEALSPADERGKPRNQALAGKSDADEPLPQGTTVGRYLLTQRVGMGGMGSVYAAYDPELDRKVAVKLLHEEPGDGSSGAASRGRLLREAQAMAKLSHPAVVTVHDVGLFGSQVFVAMEFVEGSTLRDWLRHEAPPWREILNIFVQAGEGLAAAHVAGLIHRDFKPSNVVIGSDGRPRVLDFGLARRAEQKDEHANAEATSARPPALVAGAEGEISVSTGTGSRSSFDMNLTQAGAVMGSPAYMAPEQHMGRDTDPRTDQFSFCVSLFEGLYGERPFISEDFRTLVYAILEQRIRSVPRDTKVPKSVHRAILRGLAANPADRYPSMDALLADLRRDTSRSPGKWIIAVTLAGLLGGAAFVLRPQAVTDETLAQVDAMTTSAREAAARSLYVYPPTDDPDQKTAYSQVLELERREKEFGKLARTRAVELRKEFAATLVYLGDRYWNQDGGKPFAIDYYAQALMFDDSNDRANERASLTVGQLAALRRKADEGDFSEQELAAAEPLAALAESDDKKREERLAALLESTDKAERAASTEAQLERLLSAERTPTPPSSSPRPRSTANRSGVPTQPRTGAAGVVNEKSAATPQPGERTASKEKHDPKYARELAKEGHDALQSADWKESSRLFHRALSYDRNCASALIGLSDLHFEKSERTQAITYAERAVAAAPKNAGYKIKLGDAYFKALRYEDARAEYQAAAKLGDGRAQGRLEKIARTLGE